jgi:hypothetical protein
MSGIALLSRTAANTAARASSNVNGRTSTILEPRAEARSALQ